MSSSLFICKFKGYFMNFPFREFDVLYCHQRLLAKTGVDPKSESIMNFFSTMSTGSH
jgi:hypothetical protein